MTLGGQPIEATKRYKVAGWAPVSERRVRGRRDDLGPHDPLSQGEEEITPRAFNLPQIKAPKAIRGWPSCHLRRTRTDKSPMNVSG